MICQLLQHIQIKGWKKISDTELCTGNICKVCFSFVSHICFQTYQTHMEAKFSYVWIYLLVVYKYTIFQLKCNCNKNKDTKTLMRIFPIGLSDSPLMYHNKSTHCTFQK